MTVLPKILLALGFVLAPAANAFTYELVGVDSLSLTDQETSIPDIKTIFKSEATGVSVSDLIWEARENGTDTGGNILTCQAYVGDEPQGEAGTFNLSELAEKELPAGMDCGVIRINDSGRHTVRVVLTIEDNSEAEISGDFQVFGPGVAIIPLIIVLVLAITTQMVEFSLFFAVFVGACMVAGEVNQGFKDLLEVYILEALADVDHGYVYLFTL